MILRICGACVVPCMLSSFKEVYIMLMRLTLLHQPKHAVERTRVHSKPQSGSRFWLDTQPANRQPPVATYYECIGHSNVLKNSVKIPCGELILNYFIKRRPIILVQPQACPAHHKTVAVRRMDGQRQMVKVGDVYVHVYICSTVQRGLHTSTRPHTHSAKGMHAVYVLLCQACHAWVVVNN